MRNQNKIIGQKIVSAVVCHEYIVATLENGMEIEISDITPKTVSKKMAMTMAVDLEEKHNPMIGRK